MTGKLLVFGLGYSARALCRRLQSKGWTITGTATTANGVARARALGYEAFLFDGSARSREVADALKSATHILVSAPPRDSGDPVLAWHESDIAASPSVTWMGYLSTIGVYGDRQGCWVDEGDDPAPTSERSKRRLAAENAWLALGAVPGKTVQVFRLAGIYGPGRSAIEKVENGTARRIVKPSQVFNRIHVEDIANVLEAAIAGIGSQHVYNVSDDEPAPPQDVIAFAAELLGRPAPPEVAFDKAGLSGMARSFYSENKRVRNDRLKEDLGVRLQFPSYREGLADIAGKQA